MTATEISTITITSHKKEKNINILMMILSGIAITTAQLSLCPPARAQARDAADLSSQATNLTLAKLRSGRIAGRREGPLAVYKGIPFARPPIGDLRWRPPLPPQPWRGVRPAMAFAPACMQVPNFPMNVPTQPVSEDCLYLNVLSPAKAGEHLPVIVWIHGGGFSFGSTGMPLFDGSALARKGVVFVSIAYRLGPFGYLAHPALTAESPNHSSGNYALLDQIAALRWVRDNIDRLGGDPRRVTLMGESAGAISASALAQSPLARGLFSGIIAESGGSFGREWGAMTSLASAEAEGIRFAKTLGAPTMTALRAMPAQDLIRATPQGAHAFTRMSGLPIIDGYVVPDDGLSIYRERRFNDTPILIGNNSLEGALFPPLNADAYKAEVLRRYPNASNRILAQYPGSNDAEAAQSWTALMGDAAFGLSEYVWAEAQARFGTKPVFFYHFDHSPPLRQGRRAGAAHGAELAYAFNNLHVWPIAWTQEDRKLADQMATYWTNFAKRGDPNGTSLPSWPRYVPGQPTTLYFGETGTAVGKVPSLERMRLLEEVTFGAPDIPWASPKPPLER